MLNNSDSVSSPRNLSNSNSRSAEEEKEMGGEDSNAYTDPASPSKSQQSSDEGGSSDGVLVDLPGTTDQDFRVLRGDPDGGILVNVDGSMDDAAREETFEDAPDQIGTDREQVAGGLEESIALIDIGETSGGRIISEDFARMQMKLDDTANECRKYKEEREFFGREIVNLKQQLQDTIRSTWSDKTQGYPHEVDNEEERILSSPTPLHALLKDCSAFIDDLKGILDRRSYAESPIVESDSNLRSKDKEIEDLNLKVSGSEGIKQSTDDAIIRLLASLETVAGEEPISPEDFPEDRIFLVEKRVSSLIAKHTQLLSEIRQLGDCLQDVKPEFTTSGSTELDNVFAVAREELIKSRNNEVYLQETRNKMEEENKKLTEQVERMAKQIELVNAELSKAKLELEQTENKLTATKEKLSLAVTKGKSLVQHRDSLKQSLAEKTSELERCMQELQQKSEAFQSLEANVEELKQLLSRKTIELDTCMQELKQKSEVFLAMESSVEDLKQGLSGKIGELEKCSEELQQKTNILETTAEELTVAQSLVSSLKESLSHKEKVLHEIEEAISQVKIPEDMGSSEPVNKINWILSQKNFADAIILEHENIRKAISSFSLPDDVSHGELDSQITWLASSLNLVKDDLAKMQNMLRSTELSSESYEMELLETRKEVERLKLSLAEETQEKIAFHDDLEKLKNVHLGITEKFSIVSTEKDGLIKVLQEISGSTFETETSVDTSIVRDKCLAKMRETMSLSEGQVEQLETMQRLLYLSYQELKLFEIIHEEEVIDRSKMLSDEVGRLSEELAGMKNEKDSLQKELERVEEKSALVRDKLSMAVKKGKGLVQEREALKASLEEKTLNIEKLKQDLLVKDSEIEEYQERMKKLTAYEEHIEKLESDITVFLDKQNENDQRLHNSNRRLQELIDSIERIVLPIDGTFDEPRDKVNWISDHINELVAEKDSAVEELKKVKEEANSVNIRLKDALGTVTSLEDELSKARQQICFVTEDMGGIKLHKESIEQEVEIMKEENLQQASKLKDALSNIKSLEDTLANAEKNIATLAEERDQMEAKYKQDVKKLKSELAGCMEELALTRGSLENYSIDMNNQLGHLQLILKDDSLLTTMSMVFDKTNEGFKNMDSLIRDLHDQLALKTDPLLKVSSLEGIENLITKWSGNTEDTPVNAEDVSSFDRIMEGMLGRVKFFCKIFEDYSGYLDARIASTVHSLQTTITELARARELDESKKVDGDALQAQNQVLESKLVSLQEEIKEISSATVNATRELLLVIEESGEETNNTDSASIAESLLLAVRRIKMYCQRHVEGEKALLVSKADVESKLKQAECAVEAQEVDQERISILNSDLEAMKQTCNEMKNKIEKYEAKEDMFRAKEEQFYSAQHALTALGTGHDEGHIEILVNKVNQIKVPFGELQGRSKEVNVSSPIDKLLYIIDNISDLQHRMNLLAIEKEEMQSSLASHDREIEHLKAASKTSDSNYDELQSKKDELLEVIFGLEKILQRLGGYDSGQDKKAITAKMLLAVLEKATTALSSESENSKSKVLELLAKLQGKDKIIDELSMKAKMLEESIHSRTVQQDITKERAVFETSPTTAGSDTSEIEDMGSVAKNVSAGSTSAHVRTVWKGSGDHLVLNVDPEAERLIDSKEADGKGHVFKSLNASGLIPKQGKLVADRIDGIWVSGDRLLRNRPGARLGLVAYWIFLHMWLLATIL